MVLRLLACAAILVLRTTTAILVALGPHMDSVE